MRVGTMFCSPSEPPSKLGPRAIAMSLCGRRASVTWQVLAPANPRRPHQPPRVAQPEGAGLRRWRLEETSAAATAAALEAAVPVLASAPIPLW